MAKKKAMLFGKEFKLNTRLSKSTLDLKYLNTSGRSGEIVGNLRIAVQNGSEWYVGDRSFYIDPVGNRWVVSKLKETFSRDSKVCVRVDDSGKLLSLRIL